MFQVQRFDPHTCITEGFGALEIKKISSKTCILCVRVKINMRSFESFRACIRNAFPINVLLLLYIDARHQTCVIIYFWRRVLFGIAAAPASGSVLCFSVWDRRGGHSVFRQAYLCDVLIG